MSTSNESDWIKIDLHIHTLDDPKDAVGTWDVIREDGFGLWVEGRLVPEVPRAEALRIVAALVASMSQ